MHNSEQPWGTDGWEENWYDEDASEGKFAMGPPPHLREKDQSDLLAMLDQKMKSFEEISQ